MMEGAIGSLAVMKDESKMSRKMIQRGHRIRGMVQCEAKKVGDI